MSQNAYHYESLEADEIRLFELHPGPYEQAIHGAIRKYRLTNDDEPTVDHNLVLTRDSGEDVPRTPEYSALSYTWGQTQPGPSVYITQDGILRPFRVKPNLEDALKRLRQEIPATIDTSPTAKPATLLLWVDALCINQDYIPEKNAQVQKMAQIYNRSSCVVVWLGPADSSSARAIAFIDRLLRLDDFDPLTQDPGSSADWEALNTLMNRPWFSRRWIVQEISLARRAVLYVGTQEQGGKGVEWTDFAAATALFAATHRDLGPLFKGSSAHGHQANFLGEVEALGAKRLVDVTTNLFRKNEDGVVLERLLSLEALISTLTLFEAASPHDTIYAVLWLAHDAEPDARDPGALNFEPLVRTPTQSPEIDAENTQLDTQLQSQLPWGDMMQSQSPRPMSPNPPNTQEAYPLQDSQMPPPSQPVGPARRDTFLKPPRTTSGNKPRRSATDMSKLNAEIQIGEAQPHALDVDYDKDVYDVYKQFLEFALGRSRSLDLLCHPWAPEPSFDAPPLPTWIPQLSSSPFERRPGQNSFARVRADSLVGTPGMGARNYNASGKTKIYPPKGFIQGRVLIATGFVIDAIKVKKDRAFEGIIPASWMELAEWKGPPEPVPDKFWRTLCADRGPGGQKYPPAYFASACLSYVYSKRTRRGHLNTGELLAYGKCPSIVAEFLRRVQEVVWDRSLVRTEGRKGSRRFLALVPSDAEEGDLICILYGCSVPVVLRRQRKRKATTSEHDGGRSRPPTSNIRRSDGHSDDAASSTENLSRVARGNNPPPISLSRATTRSTASDADSHATFSLSAPLEKPDSSFASANIRRALYHGSTRHPQAANIANGDDDDESQDANRHADADPLPVNLDSQHQYTMIGECFVHGMMSGEAFKHQADHRNKLRAFHMV